MRLIFIRHAEPDYTIDSLTEKGKREAVLLGKRTKAWAVDEFYVSCLGRARKTAEAIENEIGKKAEVLEWLQEFRGAIDEKYGTYHGVPWDFKPSQWTKIPELYEKDAWFEAEIMEKTEHAPGVKEVYLETCVKLDEILSQNGYERAGNAYQVREHSDKTIVFVCHMGITFAMLSHLLGIPFVTLIQGCFLPPSSVTVVNTEEIEQGVAGFRCQGMGDVRHLYLNGEPVSASGYFADVFQM